MKLSVLKHKIVHRPFRRFEIRLQDGDRYVVRHPEQIFITEDFIAYATHRGQGVLISPEAIVSIGPAPNGKEGRTR